MARKVEVEITGKDKTAHAWNSALTQGRGFATRVKGVMAGVLGASLVQSGINAIGGLFKRMIGEATQAEQSAGKLAGAISRLGVDAGRAMPSVNALVDKLSAASGLDDEDIADALGSLITKTGDLRGAMQNLNLVLDISAKENMNLDAAALLVAKTMNGNMKAVRQLGIEHTTAAGAIAELQKRYGGFAEQEGKTFNGLLTRLGTAWGNLLEKAGEFIAQNDYVRETLGKVVEWMGKITTAFSENRGEAKLWVESIVDALRIVIAELEVAYFGLATFFSKTRRDLGENWTKFQSARASRDKVYEEAAARRDANRRAIRNDEADKRFSDQYESLGSMQREGLSSTSYNAPPPGKPESMLDYYRRLVAERDNRPLTEAESEAIRNPPRVAYTGPVVTPRLQSGMDALKPGDKDFAGDPKALQATFEALRAEMRAIEGEIPIGTFARGFDAVIAGATGATDGLRSMRGEMGMIAGQTVVGFAAAFTSAFDKIADGSMSVGEAIAAAAKQAIAQEAMAQGRLTLIKATTAAISGNLAKAGPLFAAATAYFSLAAMLGGGGRSGGGGRPGVSAGGFAQQRDDLKGLGSGSATLYVDGDGLLDPSNTRQMDQLAAALEKVYGRRINIRRAGGG